MEQTCMKPSCKCMDINCPNHHCARDDNGGRVKVEVHPSPRLDWCGVCKKEHGYDCPKDILSAKNCDCGYNSDFFGTHEKDCSILKRKEKEHSHRTDLLGECYKCGEQIFHPNTTIPISSPKDWGQELYKIFQMYCTHPDSNKLLLEKLSIFFKIFKEEEYKKGVGDGYEHGRKGIENIATSVFMKGLETYKLGLVEKVEGMIKEHDDEKGSCDCTAQGVLKDVFSIITDNKNKEK